MKSKAYPLLLLCVVFFLSSIPTMAQQKSLTLMTYNIYHGENPYQPGTSNIKEIAALINKIKPDLIALQEVDSMTLRTKMVNPDGKKDLMQELGKLTSMTPFFAKAIDYAEGGYGEGILSKLPVYFDSFSLPTPAGGEGRSLAVAKLDLGNGAFMVFGATHLCHEFDENRNAQASALKVILSLYEIPVILAGDLNFTPDENPYAILSEGYLDAALVFGIPENTYSSKDPKVRIDYFWLGKNTPFEIVSVEVLDLDYSDHKPVVMKVRF